MTLDYAKLLPRELLELMESYGISSELYNSPSAAFLRPNPRAGISKEELEELLGTQLTEINVAGYLKYYRNEGRYLPVLANFDSLLKAGFIHIADIASAAPVVALSPDPCSEIVDLCAGAGGKTILLHDLVPDASIDAIDISGHMFEVLQKNRERYEAIFRAFNADATSWQGDYDFAIADVPCPSDGNLSLMRRRFRQHGISDTWHRITELKSQLQPVSERIAINAYNLLRPGSAMVYSTCTMIPEFNEGVVAHLLDIGGIVEQSNIDGIHLIESKIIGGTYLVDPALNCSKIIYYAKIRKPL
ncbi:MAG: hypothetical protein ABIJ34_02650 [archaeon]